MYMNIYEYTCGGFLKWGTLPQMVQVIRHYWIIFEFESLVLGIPCFMKHQYTT